MYRKIIYTGLRPQLENILPFQSSKTYHVLSSKEYCLNQRGFIQHGHYKFKCLTIKLKNTFSYSSAANTEFVQDNNLTNVFSTELVSPTVLEIPALISEPSLVSLGLGGHSPSGFVQTSLEFLHLNLDLPWWQAIVLGTICIRLLLFPLVIKAQRNAAELQNHMPTIQRLQQEMIQARMSGNIHEAISLSEKLTIYMKINKINPLKNFIVPMAQVPIFISVFTGIREMANLPIESWKIGGAFWFTDLTIADPYFALPLLTVATLAATIELGADGIKAQHMDKFIKTFLRSMPFITFPIICYFPSAMLCYWFTANTFSMLQVLLLKIPSVKAFFKIPSYVNHATAHPLKNLPVLPKLGFMDSLKQNMKNMELAHEMKQRKEMNSLKLKEKIKRETLEQKHKDKM